MKIEIASNHDLGKINAILKSVDLPSSGVETHLKNFFVLKAEDKIIGTMGLEVYHDKALLRSMAVVKDYQGRGLGERLYQEGIRHARRLGVLELYLLTETAEAFFAKRGFQKICRTVVPDEVQRSVEFQSACPQSAICMKLQISD